MALSDALEAYDAMPSGLGQRSVRRLDDSLVDKIAAGEVVERPASVVKELVENALDAGARMIEITAEAGGVGLIRVADDGDGIPADELPIAVLRHCTSKIADAKGLEAIGTLGFRGEALPSIGAVARLTLTSRTGGASGAASIAVEGGRVGAAQPAARARGTTVEVRDLFFATPARLKFLKSERSEAGAIADVVKRLALAAPHVGFALTLSGRTTRYPAGTLVDRARQVLGSSFADEAIVLDGTRHGVRLTGRLGLPTDGRASPQHQYASVNARVVRDKLVSGALKAGYRDVIAEGRHPAALLAIAIDPALVDVNVHPAKADVRFRDAEMVRGVIVTSIRRALAEAAPRTSRSVSAAAIEALRGSGGTWLAGPSEAAPEEGLAEPSARWTPRPSFRLPPGARAFGPRPEPRRAEAPATEAGAQAAPTEHPLGAALAQVHHNYIIAQTADGLVLVDQHAAHERIVYQRLKTQAGAGTVPSQGLLIPEVVELEEAEVALLAREAEAFARLGLVLEPFGPGAVVVRETPAVLGQLEAARLVRDLAELAAEWAADEALQRRLDKVAATMACHGSVRSGRSLGAEEMNALLRQIEATPAASQCNHGRPTFVRLSLREIERLFERR